PFPNFYTPGVNLPRNCAEYPYVCGALHACVQLLPLFLGRWIHHPSLQHSGLERNPMQSERPLALVLGRLIPQHLPATLSGTHKVPHALVPCVYAWSPPHLRFVRALGIYNASRCCYFQRLVGFWRRRQGPTGLTPVLPRLPN